MATLIRHTTDSFADRVKFNLERTQAAVTELEYRSVRIKVCRCLNAKTRMAAAAYFPYSAKRLKLLQQMFSLAVMVPGGYLYLEFVYVTDDGERIAAGLTELQPCFRREMRSRIPVSMDLLVDHIKLLIDCVQ